MQQVKTKLKNYTRPIEETKLHFQNLLTAMKNDLFQLSVTNDAGERVYITDTSYIKNGINIFMTDGTEFKLMKG